MYFKTDKQISLFEFGQVAGITLDPENRWIKKANLIDWDMLEEKYSCLYCENNGRGAKSILLALASLIIKQEEGFSDEGTVMHIKENPYMQYFCGIKEFTLEEPFVPSLMVEFRKRFNEEIMGEINEIMFKPQKPLKSDDDDKDPPNSGTLILDATCTPADVTYPQDIILCNRAREKTENMVDSVALEISQGLYAQAEQTLESVNGIFEVHANEVVKTVNTFTVRNSTPFTISTSPTSTNFNYNINDTTANTISQKYFEGTLSFDYLDSYTFDDNKNIRVISRLPISTNPVGGNMNILCDIRYGEGNNQWKNAKIRVSKSNLPLNGGTNDLYFSGNAQIKNAVLTLITHEKDLKYKTYSRHYALSDIRIENAGYSTEITALPPTGTSIKVTAEYAKHSTEVAKYAPMLITAFYKGNELVSVIIKDSPAIPESTENNILQHTMQMPSDANKIKSFVWSGDNLYQRLVDKKAIE